MYKKLNLLYLNNLVTPREYTRLETLIFSKDIMHKNLGVQVVNAKLKKLFAV